MGAGRPGARRSVAGHAGALASIQQFSRKRLGDRLHRTTCWIGGVGRQAVLSASPCPSPLLRRQGHSPAIFLLFCLEPWNLR